MQRIQKILPTLQGKTNEKTLRYPLQRVPLCTVQRVINIQGHGPSVEAMSQEAKAMPKHPKLPPKSLMVPRGLDRHGECTRVDIQVYRTVAECIV